jgi:hypothetical protein
MPEDKSAALRADVDASMKALLDRLDQVDARLANLEARFDVSAAVEGVELEAAAGAPPSGAPDAPEGAQGDGHVKDE